MSHYVDCRGCEEPVDVDCVWCDACQEGFKGPDYKQLATDALKALENFGSKTSDWEEFDAPDGTGHPCWKYLNAGSPWEPVDEILDRPEAKALLEASNG